MPNQQELKNDSAILHARGNAQSRRSTPLPLPERMAGAAGARRGEGTCLTGSLESALSSPLSAVDAGRGSRPSSWRRLGRLPIRADAHLPACAFSRVAVSDMVGV